MANEIDIKVKGTVDPSLKQAANQTKKETTKIGQSNSETSDSFKKATESSKKFGETSTEAITTLDDVIATAAIFKGLQSIYNGFYQAAEAAEQYQSSLAKVQTIADTSNTSMLQINSDIRDLSKETGQNVNDLSEATYQAISASVDTADAVSFVSKANMLAVGGFTETETAVNALTTAINAYGLSANYAESISDMFITTQNLGKTTVDELANSVGAVIPLAAAYNTNLANVLTAYAQLTKNGIDTANAGTYLRAMLNELGDTSSNVSTILYEETGKSFSQLMNEGSSLGDVLDILGDSVEGDATQFANLWQNTRSGIGALSIYNSGAEAFNETLDKMENSAGATSKAYGVMANTTEHSKEVMTAAIDDFAISIGDELDPAMNKLYKIATNLFNGASEFIKENPEVVAGITAATVGITAFSGAIAIYTNRTKIATIATAAFNAVKNASVEGIAVAAIIGLTTAIGAYVFITEDAYAASKKLTKASQEQYDELEKVKSQYKDVCEEYGDTSYQATELKQKIEELDEAFQESRTTYGDLVAEMDRLETEYSEYKNQVAEYKEIEKSCEATENLVNRLYDLAEQSRRTAAEKAEMQAIIEMLNDSIPDLSLNYSDLIDKTAKTREALLDLVDAEYNDEKYNAAKENYKKSKELLEDEQELFDQLMEQYDNSDAVKNYTNSSGYDSQAYIEYEKFMDSMVKITKEDGTEVEKSMRDMISGSNETIKQLKSDIDGYADEMAELKGITDETADATTNWEALTSSSIQSVQGELDELAQKYDEEYQAAKNSIENTVGLFNELDLDTEMTTSKMIDIWKNQNDWINKYSENLSKAQEYGLTDGLITSLSDGSEESGQYINAIITELDRLNDSDAKELVEKLNDNFKNVKDAEGDFATTVADYKLDFNGSLDEMEEKLTKTIKDFDLSEDSEKAAVKTIQAYIDGIQSKLPDLRLATDSIQWSIKQNLTPQGVSAYYTSTSTIEQNARGTKNSADIFIAGEEGPELIVGAKGSRVFTAQETEAILNGSGQSQNISYDIPELVTQLLELQAGKKASLEDYANSLSGNSDVTNDNKNYSNIVYSPTINVSGSSGSSVSTDDIQKALKLSQSEFEKYMKQYLKDQERKSFIRR